MAEDVIAGYRKDCGAGIGGGYEIRAVPGLREIGLTEANHTFMVYGGKKAIKRWLVQHGNLQVTTTTKQEFYARFGELVTQNAAQMYQEQIIEHFVNGGGILLKVCRKLKRTDWGLILTGPPPPRQNHEAYPSGTLVAQLPPLSRTPDPAPDASILVEEACFLDRIYDAGANV